MSFIQVLPLVILMVPSVPSFRRVLHSLHQVLQLQPCNTLNLLSLQTTSEWRRKELVGDNKFNNLFHFINLLSDRFPVVTSYNSSECSEEGLDSLSFISLDPPNGTWGERAGRMRPSPSSSLPWALRSYLTVSMNEGAERDHDGTVNHW